VHNKNEFLGILNKKSYKIIVTNLKWAKLGFVGKFCPKKFHKIDSCSGVTDPAETAHPSFLDPMNPKFENKVISDF
jgi:hypothetical protein